MRLVVGAPLVLTGTVAVFRLLPWTWDALLDAVVNRHWVRGTKLKPWARPEFPFGCPVTSMDPLEYRRRLHEARRATGCWLHYLLWRCGVLFSEPQVAPHTSSARLQRAPVHPRAPLCNGVYTLMYSMGPGRPMVSGSIPTRLAILASHEGRHAR